MSRQKIGVVLTTAGAALQLWMLCVDIVQREPRLKYWPVALAVAVTMAGIVLAAIASRRWLVRWRLLWRLPWKPVVMPLSSLVLMNVGLIELHERSCLTALDMQHQNCRLFPFELLAAIVLMLTGVVLTRKKSERSSSYSG